MGQQAAGALKKTATEAGAVAELVDALACTVGIFDVNVCLTGTQPPSET